MRSSNVDQNITLGIIGRGDSVENCFIDAARAMFSLMADVNKVHLIQIITFEFEEKDLNVALAKWLDLLLIKAEEHRLLFGDFRLQREGDLWKATVSGEPLSPNQVLIKSENLNNALSVQKNDQTWEARCIYREIS